jgi:hypothetical protein
MSDGNTTRLGLPATLVALGLVWTTAALSLAGQRGPDELRGKVTGVTGDRVQVALDLQEWLPRPGSAVSLGAEMAGMFVPLKGTFVIVQINADSVAFMAVGREEHGTPAPGMLAIIKTTYPHHPQSRADYVASRNQEAAVLPMAEGGDPLAQRVVAMACEARGDHDNAVIWWERSSKGSNDRAMVSRSAQGRARILAIRGAYQPALAILKEAASRTAPREGERVFGAYSTRTGAGAANAIDAHVSLLQDLGDFYRRSVGDAEESKRWFGAAADVMAAVATSGVPGPGQPTYPAYVLLVMDLARIHLHALEDKEAAVPWLQIAARAGDTGAQATLTQLGRRW